MSETRGANFNAPGHVSPIGYEINAELTLRMLNGRIALTLRHMKALGKELEMVDKLFHVRLHGFPIGWSHLVVVGNHWPRVGAQPLNTLLNDAVTFPHLGHTHQIPVVAVALSAYGHIELQTVVDLVGLGFT